MRVIRKVNCNNLVDTHPVLELDHRVLRGLTFYTRAFFCVDVRAPFKNAPAPPIAPGMKIGIRLTALSDDRHGQFVQHFPTRYNPFGAESSAVGHAFIDTNVELLN